MNTGDGHVFEFGPFVLNASRRVLSRNGELVALQPKAFDMLLRLVERRDVVLTKDELLRELWPGTFVDEANLSQNIYVLRKALGQEGGDGYIKTVPKRGYRFVADVREAGGAADPAGPTADIERPTPSPSARLTPRKRRQTPGFAIAGLLLCACATFGYVRLGRERAKAPASPRSLAVLPFNHLGPRLGDEYLGVGLCDVLITQLSSLGQLIVRPTSAVLKYEAPSTDTVAAGRELRTDAVLEGSLQRDGDRLRVTVRLINVVDGAPIWAGTFDERFDDLFKVQDAIAGDVVRALAVRLGQGDRELLSRHDTRNTDAYQLYLKGRYFWGKRTEANARKSIEYFEQAIALDSGYALAYSGLADAYWTLHFLAQSPTVEDFPSRAKAAAVKALALDDTLAEAHTSLGQIKEVYDLDFGAAEGKYKRALALNPNYAVGHQRYGFLLSRMGRIDEAMREFGRALALDPLSPLINTDAARPFIQSGDYRRAIEQLHAALEIDPNFARAHNLLAYCYTDLGRYDEAAREAQRAAELAGPPGASSRLSYQLYFHALAYVALGDRDRAFVFIQQLYETRNIDFAALKSAPAWDGLRDDARFQSLLRRSGLTP